MELELADGLSPAVAVVEVLRRREGVATGSAECWRFNWIASVVPSQDPRHDGYPNAP